MSLIDFLVELANMDFGSQVDPYNVVFSKHYQLLYEIERNFVSVTDSSLEIMDIHHDAKNKTIVIVVNKKHFNKSMLNTLDDICDDNGCELKINKHTCEIIINRH